MIYLKKILFVLAVAAVGMLSAVSCSKESDLRSDIIGEWHFSDMETDVFIEFRADGDYELFQKIGAGRYRGYAGKWKLEKNILSGTYNEGDDWGSSYRVDIKSFDTLVLSAMNGSEEKNIYKREDIPADVRESALIVKY